MKLYLTMFEQVLGKVGIVASVNVRMTYVGIYYPFNANGYSLVMDAIEKVRESVSACDPQTPGDGFAGGGARYSS